MFRELKAAEVISEIQKVTPAERREVWALSMHTDRSEDPQWRNELGRCIEEARAGRSLTSAEVRALVAEAKAAR